MVILFESMRSVILWLLVIGPFLQFTISIYNMGYLLSKSDIEKTKIYFGKNRYNKLVTVMVLLGINYLALAVSYLLYKLNIFSIKPVYFGILNFIIILNRIIENKTVERLFTDKLIKNISEYDDNSCYTEEDIVVIETDTKRSDLKYVDDIIGNAFIFLFTVYLSIAFIIF